MTVELYGKPIVMQIDTSSAKSLIPETMFKEHFANLPVTRSYMVLRTYNHETISKELKLNWTNILAVAASEHMSVKSVLDRHRAVFQEGSGTAR